MSLKYGWFGTEVSVRPCVGTYELYRSEIPEIPAERHAGLAFIRTEPNTISEKERNPAGFLEHPCQQKDLASNTTREKLLSWQQQYGSDAVSDDFVALLSTELLQDQIPSCTACYFFLGEPFHLPQLKDHGAETLVLFYRDQQDCVLWYLILAGEHRGKVLASFYWLDKEGDDEEREQKDDDSSDRLGNQKISTEYLLKSCVLVGQSVSEFIYRLWVENHLWFQNEEGDEEGESIENGNSNERDQSEQVKDNGEGEATVDSKTLDKSDHKAPQTQMSKIRTECKWYNEALKKLIPKKQRTDDEEVNKANGNEDSGKVV